MMWGKAWCSIQWGPGFCLRQCWGRVEQRYSSNAFWTEGSEGDWVACHELSFMTKVGEQGREKGHPALPMQLPQPISLHVLFSNTVNYIFCDRTCRWTSSEFWYLQERSWVYCQNCRQLGRLNLFFNKSSMGLKAWNPLLKVLSVLLIFQCLQAAWFGNSLN